jgi:DNA adenine methylase|tara:strand:- start:544 stop:1443 length:900 start_codon:yes stop_codon:yes gene_type:complete
MKTLIRYAGGKSKAIKHITPFVDNYDKIVSPFLGGGSLEVHWAGNLNKQVIGYDIFDMLVIFWKELLNNPIKLSETLKNITPDTDEYKRIKEILMTLDNTQEMLKDWKTDYYKRENIIELENITKAAYYYFNHNCSYGPGYLGWGSSVYLKQDKWNKMVEKIKNFKCSNLSVYQLPFEKSIKKHTNDFLYLDPPYFLEKDKDNKMHKGMYPMKNIDIHHSGFDHELLRDLLLNHKGDFVISYNNCETIREYYKDFDFYFPEWSYSMSNGETRIGKNRKEFNNNEIVKKSHEILIIKRKN